MCSLPPTARNVSLTCLPPLPPPSKSWIRRGLILPAQQPNQLLHHYVTTNLSLSSVRIRARARARALSLFVSFTQAHSLTDLTHPSLYPCSVCTSGHNRVHVGQHRIYVSNPHAGIPTFVSRLCNPRRSQSQTSHLSLDFSRTPNQSPISQFIDIYVTDFTEVKNRGQVFIVIQVYTSPSLKHTAFDG